MKVAIIGGNVNYLKEVDDLLMKLIEESGYYLFDVIGGSTSKDTLNETLGSIWAKYRGLPYRCKIYPTLDLMIRGVAAAADYIIFLNDGSQIMKRFIMTYKQTGKHGSIINIKGD